MNIVEAALKCKIRGYIQQYPDGGLKLWRNSSTFFEDVASLMCTENSWECFDSEKEIKNA